MTTTMPDQLNVGQPRVSGLVTLLRSLYLLLVILFAGAVVLQVFYAGATLLVDARYLVSHRSLGEAMWPLPFLMIAVSLFARLPRRFVLLSVLVFVLYVMQYVLVHVVPSLGLPTVFRGLHAINALLIFGVSLRLLRSTMGVLRPASQAA